MAAKQEASEKTLEGVAKQLADVNSGIDKQISLSEQAGFHQRKAMAIAADSATELAESSSILVAQSTAQIETAQNSTTELAQPIATLVRQGEAQIEAAQDAARSAAEAAREAARKGDEEPPEIAVKLETEKDEGWFSGVIGTIIAAISGAVLGSMAGLAIGFVKMWGDIFKFIGKTFTKIFPNTSKMLGDIFGKGGKISKFFTSIKLFFTESKAFKVMDDFFNIVFNCETGKMNIDDLMQTRVRSSKFQRLN